MKEGLLLRLSSINKSMEQDIIKGETYLRELVHMSSPAKSTPKVEESLNLLVRNLRNNLMKSSAIIL